MINDMALFWCRTVPVEHGKDRLERFIRRPSSSESAPFRGQHDVTYELDWADGTPSIMWKIYTRGIHERNTYRHIVSMFRGGLFGEKPVFLDIGANIGSYALNVAKLAPHSTVHAFEPNPIAIDYLERNIALNGVSNVRVHKFGLSREVASFPLYNDSLSQASIHKKGGTGRFLEISVKPLDLVAEEEGIDRVDLIKIDVEGHESAVLDGALRTFEKNKRLVVIMEIDRNADLVGTREQLFERMLNMGFSAYLPKGYPFSMKRVRELAPTYEDNVIFRRGF
ncbi:FkbM family methyltransferase [Rhodomicrobium sp. Az07]|uniref:FkbM family methyltransferase n=1 Tax=Rhodomicrobium sp. Az07 TaxID=2839034 RepID=UPI001BE79A11|nr:FkbM family methyltransferase [Rhodomicrobium sp. Az07]MBT3071910.1 FkbM family methyltransferase [Rhodomicrobium sp. Az07]